MSTISDNPIMAGILGVIVGDALGLPVQFEGRSARDAKPVTEMIGYGVFSLPPTHGHPRTNVAGGIYIAMAVELLQGKTPQQAYKNCLDIINKFYQKQPYKSQLDYFSAILRGNIDTRSRNEINSSGYVVDTLETAFWCLLTTDNYADAVLTAVNLGEDTDTTAAVTGGLAGIYYGLKGIPEHWLIQIQKLDEIVDLVDLFAKKIDD